MHTSKRIVLCLLPALVFSTTIASEELYYLFKGNRIPIQLDQTRVVLAFDKATTEYQRDSLLSSFPELGRLLDSTALSGFLIYEVKASPTYSDLITSLRANELLWQVEPGYLTATGDGILLGDRFCVAFRDEIDQHGVDSINQYFGAAIEYKLKELGNIYVLRNTKASRRSTLDLANLYGTFPDIGMSHPLFASTISQDAYRTYDYYRSLQYSLKQVVGSFDSASAWDFYGRKYPIVAVLDDGFAPHEDFLDTNFLSGKNFAVQGGWDSSNVLPGVDLSHGMQCAGIISARHATTPSDTANPNSGVFGLNPRTKLLPVRIINNSGNFVVDDSVAAAITWARNHGAAVISCSWSFDVGVYSGVIDTAIFNAYLYGRNGRGSLCIFSTGNRARNPQKTQVSYPAAGNYNLGVGACDSAGYRWDYSQYAGDEVDVVAPSGDINFLGDIWSTDQMGDSGTNVTGAFGKDCSLTGGNDVDYECTFGGTSAACATVSGIASLVLTCNDTLPAYRIREILKFSAAPLPNCSSNECGYGRADAFRAVLSVARGDLSHDGQIDLSDLARYNAFFADVLEIEPTELLADCDCSGTVDLDDLSYCIAFLVANGFPPVIPCYEY